jgi:nucleotide-binding universal stress UspA family protein
MLKSILVASDLSIRSDLAVRRAVHLAGDAGARLTVLHVVEDTLPDDMMNETSSKALRHLKDRVAALGHVQETEVVIGRGQAFHVITEEARERNADLIVLGAHRRLFLRDVFVGTTIERVTRTAGRPVLMANGPAGERWRKVFIATDLSATSGDAAKTAHRLGLLDGAEVTFVHVYAPVTRQMMNFAGIPADRVQEEAEREFMSTRRDVAQFLDGLDLDVLRYTARIVEGAGAEAIAGLVAQAKPDLLVLGTRGLSGTRRMFLGSVTHELMDSLGIDIFAVPPGGPPA